MAREIEEREIHPELYEEEKKGYSEVYPWRIMSGEVSIVEDISWYDTVTAEPIPAFAWTDGTVSASDVRATRLHTTYVPVLIGGPCAGQRLRDPNWDNPTVAAVDRPRMSRRFKPDEPTVFNRHVYHRASFRYGEVELVAYVFAGWSPNPISFMQELVDGYYARR